jgi:hypothetical protein
MSHRSQTLYGLEDSPVGLAAWMLDHDAVSEAQHNSRNRFNPVQVEDKPL